MNINDLSSLRNCTSCQMCAAVCPKNAISISLDKDGFYRPIIEDKLCIDCGICKNVCYKYDEKISLSDSQKLLCTDLYGAYAKDQEIVKNTTSGGIADVLAHQLIKEGYKCVGVIYDGSNDIAINKIVCNEHELRAFRGSKYIQSYTFDAFKEIVRNCKTEKFAVFGTPCHIYALHKYFNYRKIRDNHILIDLYCHGCPSMNIWKKYIKEVKISKSLSKVDNVNFRSKVKGWGNFYLELLKEDRAIYYSNNRNNEFFDLFFSDLLLNDACNDCVLRSTLEYTDIRLGDFWGKRYVMNCKGVSAVSIVSEKAKRIFEIISPKLNYRKEEYSVFLPWQSWGKLHHPNLKLRKILFEQLKNDNTSLKYCINTIHSQQSIKRKLSRYGKSLVHTLPLQFEKIIRWIFYRI